MFGQGEGIGEGGGRRTGGEEGAAGTTLQQHSARRKQWTGGGERPATGVRRGLLGEGGTALGSRRGPDGTVLLRQNSHPQPRKQCRTPPPGPEVATVTDRCQHPELSTFVSGQRYKHPGLN